ncbi:MAG: hypothetical protein J6S12_04685, partial [Alphaproteobacteria bacterium]|nr:hypothetical protein [Alphaproteobacteria bacterium]
TYNNLGTYEGPVSDAAEYADILYQVGEGQYLPAGSEGVGAVCTAGNYCPGLTNATYNATDNQGLTTCPDGYPMSESGASVNTQCYTTCTDKSVIAHATAVAVNDYYGNGTATCYPTACDNGYHTYNGIEMFEQDPLVPGADVSLYASTYGSVSVDGSRKDNESAFGLTEAGTWGGAYSYATVYGQASCQGESPNTLAMNYYSGMVDRASATADEVRAELTAMVGEGAADAVADVYAEYKAGTKTKEELWKTAWAILGTEENANFSKTDSGQYCYCQMTAYSAGGPSGQIPVASAPWVFRGDRNSADDCAYRCAYDCARNLRDGDKDWRAYQAAMYGMLGTRTVGVCAANEISITWADADPADGAANNAGVCTYDGDIRTPTKAITKPGKTFKGWKFQKSN